MISTKMMQASVKRAVVSLLRMHGGPALLPARASHPAARTVLDSVSKQARSYSSLAQSSRPSQSYLPLRNQTVVGRQFCQKTEKVMTPAAASTQAKTDVDSSSGAKGGTEHFSTRHPTDFDKKLLVYFGKYKTAEEIPDLVSIHTLNASRNKFRIFVNLVIGAMTVVSCVVVIYSSRGHIPSKEGLEKINMKRHPKHYEKQLQE